MPIVTATGVAVNTRTRTGRRQQAEMIAALSAAQAAGVKDAAKLKQAALVAREIAKARSEGIDLKHSEALARLKAS